MGTLHRFIGVELGQPQMRAQWGDFDWHGGWEFGYRQLAWFQSTRPHDHSRRDDYLMGGL